MHCDVGHFSIHESAMLLQQPYWVDRSIQSKLMMMVVVFGVALHQTDRAIKRNVKSLKHYALIGKIRILSGSKKN